MTSPRLGHHPDVTELVLGGRVMPLIPAAAGSLYVGIGLSGDVPPEGTMPGEHEAWHVVSMVVGPVAPDALGEVDVIVTVAGGVYRGRGFAVSPWTPPLDGWSPLIIDGRGPLTAVEATLYTRDNGAGKTQLVVRLATGAVQVVATQP